MSRKIQQHMYTRERKGIFHDTAGYDTIAVSEGLEPSFVKKYLHPFCYYHAPKTLRERGEKDPSLYPPAVTIVQPETGDLVMGQAVFIPADFTGTRSTYFMHTYVIPPLQKEEWVLRPEMLFQLETFQTAYDLSNGPVLPELDVVPFHDTTLLEHEILKALGISHDHFQQLLFAVMTSISGKKKVFISLNVPLQEYTNYALLLLELLYLYLPYTYRRNLGAITFTSEPETRTYIHVTFFEPGTLNLGDRSIEKQFVFDFSRGFISGVSVAVEQSEYLDIALQHLTEMKRMDDFFKFAEMALAGLAEEEKHSLASYNQLTGLYLTWKNGDFDLYLNDKLRFLNNLVKYLQLKSEEKSELVELFLRILDNEKMADDWSIARFYTESVVSVNRLLRFDEVCLFLLETLRFYQKDPLYLELWKIIERDRLAYESLVCSINEKPDYKDLLNCYLNLRINNLKLEEITCLGEIISNELLVKVQVETTRDHLLILKVLSKLLNFPTESASQFIKLLTKNGRDQLNKTLQRILCEFPSSIPIQLFFVVFETSGDGVDYPKLLDFIIDHFNENTMCSFIKKNANLVATDILYRKSLKIYFITHPKSIWKDKKWRKELQDVNDDKFKLLIKEVEKDTANPLVRFLKKTGINF
ncbi:hypothetical protein COJ85_18400 [Bacillus sp. AFS076308]|uniref:GAP1-N2 domain-containing protein n=1 Tax=Bacillus sp. AFS076308 TaxID=2033512 RepID=UPI000BF5F772|nr:hypothetical protein [Bacillus sp. AFS076308]PFO00001.1 hypothetical protein COJ85_18400 [Bacillus sp. AFS076308]